MATAESSGKRRFSGKVAVVTGAGRGIGRAEAMLLGQQGAKVVVNDLGGGPIGGGADDRVAAQVVEEIRAAGGAAVANYDNVATMEGGARIVQTAIDSFGRLDILINNAGIVRPRIIYNMSESDWDDVIAVHMKGTFSTTRAAAMIFREHKSGVIVNTASESGLGHLGQSSYSAAKEGIVGFTRTIARDLGRFNVRCNPIRPRAATRLFDEEALKAMERTRAMMGDRGIPVPTVNPLDNKPEQVAALAIWLCTDASAGVNGRTFVVGGEMVRIYPEPEPIRTMIHEGGWGLDALDRTAPTQLIAGLRNEFVPRG